MNQPIINKLSYCARLFMSDVHKEAIEKSEGKSSIVIYVVPKRNLAYGATHAIYQGIPNGKPSDHPLIGHAKFYQSGAVPAELQTPDLFS